MAEHSELPWHSDDTAIFGRDGVIARIPNHPENGKNWKIDAPYIVLAANHHHELVEALEIALEIMELDIRREGIDCTNATPDSAIGKARAVLAALNEASR